MTTAEVIARVEATYPQDIDTATVALITLAEQTDDADHVAFIEDALQARWN
jgi:hypothetical protein